MAATVIGNTEVGEYCTTWDMAEDEDGNPAEMELVCDASFVGYQWTATGTYSGSVEIGFYVRIPSTDAFDNVWGEAPPLLAPVVCTLNSSGLPSELLNASCEEINLWSVQKTWVKATVTLKRAWQTGEVIFFGVYGPWLCPVWNKGLKLKAGTPVELQGDSYPGYGKTGGVASAMKDGRIFTATKWIEKRNFQFSVYASFVAPENYVRTLTAKTTIKEKFTGKASYARKNKDADGITDQIHRMLTMLRDAGCDVSHLIDTEKRTASSVRTTGDTVTPSALARLARTITTLVHGLLNATAQVHPSRGLLLSLSESMTIAEHADRQTDAYRASCDDITLPETVHGGRWVTRTIQSFSSWWDALRGRRREENCTVRLFCPITTELKIKGRIK